MDTSTNGKTWAIVGIVVALVIGAVGGYASGAMNNNKSSDSTAPTTQTVTKEGVVVGGALMVRDKDIVDNAVQANNVTTLVSLVKLAGLVDTLKSEGPFTVFAPDNAAFGKLPAATVTALQQPENVATLKKILTYHVVPGTYTSAALKVMAEKGQTLTSVEGEVLTPSVVNGKIVIKDANGGSSTVETADVISSNGVTHVVDTVLQPKS
ncbi:MAG: beta-Ig-H3/fasciclin [Candidatus Saccharibacteria bacterium]|nr:beta-Ig-H3/fasciclin [Candidatus Saccharibacteria bacterium]